MSEPVGNGQSVSALDRDPPLDETYWRVGQLTKRRTDQRADIGGDLEFRELADNLPTLCWIADPDGYIRWYNRRWHEYCGTTPEQMEGWGWQQVHDPAVLPEVMTRWQASIATGEPFEMTFPLRGADGVFRPFLTRIIPVRDEAGRLRRWIGNNIDVSRQVAVEQELRESERRLREANRSMAERESFLSSVLASSTDCIKVLSLDGRLQFMSEGGQRVMEVSDFNAIAGCPWPDFWSGEGNHEARAAVAAAVDGRSSSFIGSASTMAGSPKWWHVAVSPIPGPDGRPERILSVSRDITDLRESEEERDRFIRLVQNSGDFIAMAGKDGRVFYVNDAGRRMVGLEGEDVTVRTIADFFPPEDADRVAAEVLPAVERDGRWTGELHFRHFGTGASIPVLYSVFPITDASGAITGYGTVTRDFRDHKAAEEQLLLLNGELSHRLKNTLGVVQAIAVQTLGQADREMVSAFSKRLNALSTAHDVLLKKSWTTARLYDVVVGALASFDQEERFVLDGPDLAIGPRATLALSLLIHELATNATKYGALSVAGGTVTLEWSVAGTGADAEVTMRWAERGGPPAHAPKRKGFGSRIIKMGLTGSGGVDLRYRDEGLTVIMTAPLEQLQQA